MNRARHILVAVLIMLLPLPAYAQRQCPKQIYADPTLSPDFDCPGPGEDELLPQLELKVSVPLNQKQPAPWDGILMDRNRVLKLGFRIKAVRRLRWEELQYCSELAAAEVDYVEANAQAEIDLLKSQRENYKLQTDVLQEEIARRGKWYRSPAIWFTVGFVVAAAGATAIAFAVRD